MKNNIREKVFSFKNDLNELASLNGNLETLEAEWQLAPDLILRLNLVLEELITNTIFYGIEDGQSHEITIKFALDDNVLTITVIDDGIAFNPLELPPPDLDANIEDRKIGGLGIFLVREVMDDVSYSRENNNNIVVLKKNL